VVTEGQLLGAAWAVLRERSGRLLVLDLTGVGFVGSLGLSELIMLGHEAASYRQEVRIVVGRNNPLQRAMASAKPGTVVSDPRVDGRRSLVSSPTSRGRGVISSSL
jgi:hypothetical protein